MALPDLIEIEPIRAPIRAEVSVPGSKSITNRALILGALKPPGITLTEALWSEDTQVMVDCLEELGLLIFVNQDPNERSNRRIDIGSQGTGKMRCGGTRERPLELFVGNAGTAARFLAAFVCLGKGFYRLQGVERMHQRPQGALFKALRQLGYNVESVNDCLPVLIEGSGPRPGQCEVSLNKSSQFASALLMAGLAGGWKVTVTGENAEESPYVAMTNALIEKVSRAQNQFPIEPDASSASYFWGAGWLLKSDITVPDWRDDSLQVDNQVPKKINPDFPSVLSRQTDLGDSIMTAIVLAPFAKNPVRFTDLGRLRVQECERVAALREQLSRCGAQVREMGDTLEIQPGPLHGAEIETYNDHRMAMCFATLGLKVPGIKIKNPACVKKTFPDFFEKLASAPPHGLGAIIKDRRGRVMKGDELLAE